MTKKQPFSEKVKSIDFKATVLVENIAETLTDAILKGVFKRGDKLVEMDLREQFGISRTPIREAFRVLEKKGLVEIIPRKGAFVKRISKQDIQEHFPVRSALEGLAAREAYKNISQEDIEALSSIVVKMRAAAKKNDPIEYFKVHTEFHEIFINASGNELLINMLQTLRMHMIWDRYSTRYYEEDYGKSIKVHEKILRYFKEKTVDPDEVERIVRVHIEVAVGAFTSYLDTNTPPDE
ncbi:MAG: GntR family transcriptional regulator [Deltaproteobacteria bacterium]|nr:GntR family transcriptional regulator [Deltaproteobacteria bacterium]